MMTMEEESKEYQEIQKTQPPETQYRKAENVENNFKSTVAQIVLAFAKFTGFLVLSISMSFMGVALPLLYNGSAGFTVSPESSSLLVSTVYLTATVGILLNIPLEKWGRKPIIICGLICLEINWIIMYFAEDIWALVISRALVGIGMGLLTCLFLLVAETCEPRMRGVLDTISSAIISLGFNISSLMCLINNFREIVFLNVFLPLATIIYIYFIPESPLWLCTQGRYKEALESLTWLRGWQYNDSVQIEFNKLKEYCSKSYTPRQLQKNNNECFTIVGVDNPVFECNQSSSTKLEAGNPSTHSKMSNPPSEFHSAGEISSTRLCEKWFMLDNIFNKVRGSYKVEVVENDVQPNNQSKERCDYQFVEDGFLERIKYLFSKDMLRPMAILTILSLFIAITPNILFPNYLPLIVNNFIKDGNYQQFEISYGISLLVGHFVCACLVKYTGKKRLLLHSMIQNVINMFCFTVYDIFKECVHYQWLLHLLLIWNGVANCIGATTVFYPFIGELLPVRERVFATVLIFIILALLGFLSTFIFPYVFFSIPFYVITIFFLILYFFGYLLFNKLLIETEGKTLQEINSEMDD